MYCSMIDNLYYLSVACVYYSRLVTKQFARSLFLHKVYLAVFYKYIIVENIYPFFMSDMVIPSIIYF